MTSPAEYRAFLLDKNDHTVRRYDFEAVGHTTALEHARQYIDGHDVEVWHGTYLLGRLKHEK